MGPSTNYVVLKEKGVQNFRIFRTKLIDTTLFGKVLKDYFMKGKFDVDNTQVNSISDGSGCERPTPNKNKPFELWVL